LTHSAYVTNFQF